MSALYKPLKEKLWREAEEGLGLKEVYNYGYTNLFDYITLGH